MFLCAKSEEILSLDFCYESKYVVMSGLYSILVYAINPQTKEEKIETIPVVCEFEDVFPKELPGQPQQREIDFGIELIPGA